MRHELQPLDHAFLGGDKTDIGMQPPAQRLDRLGVRGQSFGKLGQLVDFVAIDRLEQGFTRRKMPIERADADTSLPCHRFQAGLWPAGAEDLRRSLKQQLAIAD